MIGKRHRQVDLMAVVYRAAQNKIGDEFNTRTEEFIGEIDNFAPPKLFLGSMGAEYDR